jgi:hypothetical protein
VLPARQVRLVLGAVITWLRERGDPPELRPDCPPG